MYLPCFLNKDDDDDDDDQLVRYSNVMPYA